MLLHHRQETSQLLSVQDIEITGIPKINILTSRTVLKIYPLDSIK
jgi:hypothetical protein